MSETSTGSGGLLAAATRSAATLLASGRTRIELLGNELHEEKLRAVSLLLVSLAVAFCLMFGTMLAITLLLVVFWDTRVVLLGGFTVLFFAIGGLTYLALKRALRAPRSIFRASLAELGEDIRQLRGAVGNESTTD